MNKYDIIQKFFENRKMTTSQKERFFLLVNKELIKESETEIKLLERLDSLEKKINGEVVDNEEVGSDIGETKKKPKHKPKDTSDFLQYFTDSEYVKYLTHRFNGEKPCYDEFINSVKNEFESCKEKYPSISSKILKRFEQFALDENPNWYIFQENKKIEINKGWSQNEFKNWYINSACHPADDEFWNREMIQPFKHSIEVRTGDLTQIILEKKKTFNMFDIVYDKNKLDSAEFYTNVDMLHSALNKIFQMIKDASSINFLFEVDVRFEEVDGINVLSICHKNSECNKESKYQFKKGDFTDLISNLWDMGNLDIEAKFNDGFFRKYILTDNKEYNKTEPINEVSGFTYNLKFY